MAKADSAFAPLGVGGDDIFGNKGDARWAADQLVLVRVRVRGDESQNRCAVWRRDPYPALSLLRAQIEGETESELIDVETQALILIAHEDIDGMNAEV